MITVLLLSFKKTLKKSSKLLTTIPQIVYNIQVETNSTYADVV